MNNKELDEVFKEFNLKYNNKIWTPDEISEWFDNFIIKQYWKTSTKEEFMIACQLSAIMGQLVSAYKHLLKLHMCKEEKHKQKDE